MMKNQEFEFSNKADRDFFRAGICTSGMPTQYFGVRLGQFKPCCPQAQMVYDKIQKYIENIANGGPQQSMLFLGNNGTEKTHLACAIAQELFFHGQTRLISAVRI